MALYFTRSTNVTNAKDFGLHFCAAKLHLHSSFNEARESYKEAVLGGIQLRVDRLQTQRDEVVEDCHFTSGCCGCSVGLEEGTRPRLPGHSAR